MTSIFLNVVFTCFIPVSLQELSGQQQNSSEEFDFPVEDDTFSSSEFREEGADFTVDHAGSSYEAAGATGVGVKQSLFEGYKDPSKQFGGHARSYHRDARYGRPAHHSAPSSSPFA